ncbi:MAG: ComEC/Rec2 family competence protein [Minisyncoccales bacterium]
MKIKILLIFSFIVFLLWGVVFYYSNPLFSISFLDVGQGDAIFIETPSKKQILIDGGPDRKVLKELNKRLPFWDRKIDLLVLTHPDHDHIRGLIDVLKYYEVENILFTGVSKSSKEYKEWLKNANLEKSRVFIAQKGQDFKMGEVEFDILYPFENHLGREVSNINNSSIVTKLKYKDKTFLLTGDIEKKVEEKIIKEYENISADILKIGHHGSRHSTGKSFLKKVKPEIAVIQVGENDYGHPSELVLNKLNNFNIPVLRNDLDKEVIFFSDGFNLYH